MLSSRNGLFYANLTGVVNNPSTTKLSYKNGKTPFWILRSLFLPKKVNPRIFKRWFSKKMEKIPNSHIIHLLEDEYCWIVRDSEPIRLLKSPRSLILVYILKLFMHDLLFIQTDVIGAHRIIQYPDVLSDASFLFGSQRSIPCHKW